MRFERLDLNLLVALDALIEYRSVSTSAKRLFLSQPAVSGSLNRLRDFFGDDLLVQVGRQMMLTPKAEELRAPVREALMLIRAKITTPREFDPTTARRHFTIIASDYVYNVLLTDVFAQAALRSPHLAFDVLSTGKRGTEMMEQGEADILITIPQFHTDDHPRVALFEDKHAVVAWRDGHYGARMTHDDFYEAHHAVVLFGRDRHPAFSETFFEQRGMTRNIQLRVPTFSALAPAVLGTDRIATMYDRHAQWFARFLPLTVHRPPIDMPDVVEELQWHSLRNSDQGLQWLIALIRECAANLAPLKNGL
ncbi:LysR family transcriptional regulator [Sphingobium sp. HWE2-09]|uniref:LysR family transcriptional regulator n=1 Tax=Sphingobium sp. HWE2-09 TaxID=3108390 RepID=UPI002DCCBCF5|nr:LysR family transcriptional regulator [Sphingobium sp. HWE2-09]